MIFGATLGEHLMMAGSAKMCYITIDYKNKAYIGVAASNINNEIHQLFSKQRFLVSAWSLHSGKSQETCYKLAFK